MADAKISQLPVASTPLAGTELVPVVQGGATEQTTVEAILTGTVPSGTANGVLYLNGSKVVTSGSALTFDGSTFSNVQGSGTSALSFNQLSFSRNGANYLTATLSSLNYGASQHIFGNNDLSSEWMRLTSTGLGIGTNNPVNPLNIVRDNTAFRGQLSLQTVSASNFAQLTFYDQTTLSGQIYQAYGVDKVINIVNPLAHGIAFWTTNTERMRLDSSGNLGLGVTPSASWTGGANLQIGLGAVYANSSLGACDVSYNSVRTASNSYVYAQTGLNATRLQQRDGAFNFFTALSGTAGDPISFTQAMTLDASGNLLVGGTSGPYSAANRGYINISGSTDSVLGLSSGSTARGYLQGTATTVTLGATIGSAITFDINGERARIDSSGNLGLGVTPTTGGYGKGFQFSGDPASDLGTLWIQPINTNDHRVSLTNNAKNSGVGSWAYFASSQSATMYEQVAGQHRWTTAGTGTAGNAISFTQAMTLTANGNLLVGATALPSASVEGICFTGTTSGNFSSSGASTAAYNHLLFYNGNGIVGSISTTGSATTYSTSSDYRLKNITGPITTSGAYIDSLNPVEGTWKADGSTFVGLIAHEVQEASRTTVATGVKDGEQMQGMDYSSAEIIANLIAEVNSGIGPSGPGWGRSGIT
jgi:hypothetical protein